MVRTQNELQIHTRTQTEAMIYVVMGVSGCGKSTIGKLLADHLHIPFYDADDFHPQKNIDKMSRGNPLNDSDRWPWLDSLRSKFNDWDEKGAVLACSALKESYRLRLSNSGHLLTWIFLNGDSDLILSRMNSRKGHYMKADMLQSQFDTLEKPEYGLSVSIDQKPEQILEVIKNHISHD